MRLHSLAIGQTNLKKIAIVRMGGLIPETAVEMNDTIGGSSRNV
ncbi:hypothetical protein RB2083_216 [Rhodobacteraceae bacterium HTCC2083]|nr:hypothetical protein RB2083_216 [Rhodobacteraceae bacterium HTCC2083]